MANIIRSVFAVFWVAAAGTLAYLAYSVLRTEHNPQSVRGWLVLCAFAFISATWLTYNIFFSRRDSSRQ